MSKHDGDLISRSAAIETLRKSHEAHADNSREISLLARDIRLLKEEPSVDAVEVVRCSECVYRHRYDEWDRDSAESYVRHECRLLRNDFGDDGFCSCGERRDGE